VLRRLGYDVVKVEAGGDTNPYPPDCDQATIEVIERIAPYTLTSHERVMALCASVEHIVAAGVPGALVECGVWRGGSSMAMALTLRRLGVTDRDLYMFDTFTHMPFPGEEDVDLFGTPAADQYEAAANAEAFRYLPFDEVKRALASTGYPTERMHFVQGMVEETIPEQAPEQIALCRLDTDWYESTAHEMEHLWPRVAPGGIVIIDDYGHFMGAKKAVDEHFGRIGPTLLHRIDFTGRLVVKGG
jgi:hypothetical protein